MTQVIVVSLTVGAVAGLYPLILGIRTKQLLLGVVGFLLSLGVGQPWGFCWPHLLQWAAAGIFKGAAIVGQTRRDKLPRLRPRCPSQRISFRTGSSLCSRLCGLPGSISGIAL